MNTQMIDTTDKSDRANKWLGVMFAFVVLIAMVFAGFVAPVSAGSRTRVSGIGYVPEEGECTDAVKGPDGQDPDFATRLDGDLAGCQYTFVETHQCYPGGFYRETGFEIFVVDGVFGKGTFDTTYIFKAKFEGCEDGWPTGDEIYGGCHHPIVPGTGTGDYEGVAGWINFNDDVVAGNFPYRGILKWW